MTNSRTMAENNVNTYCPTPSRSEKFSGYLGIIESNGQIIRNESGQTKHRPFTGVYEENIRKGYTEHSTGTDAHHEKESADSYWTRLSVAVVQAMSEIYLAFGKFIVYLFSSKR